MRMGIGVRIRMGVRARMGKGYRCIRFLALLRPGGKRGIRFEEGMNDVDFAPTLGRGSRLSIMDKIIHTNAGVQGSCLIPCPSVYGVASTIPVRAFSTYPSRPDCGSTHLCMHKIVAGYRVQYPRAESPSRRFEISITCSQLFLRAWN